MNSNNVVVDTKKWDEADELAFVQSSNDWDERKYGADEQFVALSKDQPDLKNMI